MISADSAGRNRNWFQLVFGYSLITGILILAGSCFLTAVASPPAAAVSRRPVNDPAASSLAAPVDIVIAVDESESIKQPEMALEQTAARLIALGEFAPQSRIGVLGFGGPNKNYNAETNPQPPVDPVCPMTEVDTLANRQSLNDCIGKLRTRNPRQGDHTDFIAAITAGVSDLVGTRDTGRPLLLFLLTDGQLDMFDAPGFTESSENAANIQGNFDLQTSTLPTAKTDGVRIWPLGFGPDVYLPELQQIATGGAQGSCDTSLPDATPRAITVASASEIEGTLLQIFANARCLKYSPGQSALIKSGSSANLSVTVPDVATAGSLEVIRQSPQISVTYFDPDNQQVRVSQGPQAGQTFSLAGANGPVESLSVRDPIPGRWRVHVAAGPGVPQAILVTTSVLWQGVLHSDIVTTPADPEPGQAVTVTVKLQVNTRALSASDLAGVRVSVRITGKGLAAPVSVPVNDDGIPPDQTAHDGVYTGTFTVPRSMTGILTAEGVVSAQGVTGDAHSATITINSTGLLVTGQMTLPSGKVAQGGQVTGTARFSNPADKPCTIRLVPEDTPPGVTITPSTITLSAASSARSYPFTVHFATSIPVGTVTGHINAADAVTGSVYAQAEITSQLVAPPAQHRDWWYLLLIAPIALIAIQLARTLRLLRS